MISGHFLLPLLLSLPVDVSAWSNAQAISSELQFIERDPGKEAARKYAALFSKREMVGAAFSDDTGRKFVSFGIKDLLLKKGELTVRLEEPQPKYVQLIVDYLITHKDIVDQIIEVAHEPEFDFDYLDQLIDPHSEGNAFKLALYGFERCFDWLRSEALRAHVEGDRARFAECLAAMVGLHCHYGQRHDIVHVYASSRYIAHFVPDLFQPHNEFTHAVQTLTGKPAQHLVEALDRLNLHEPLGYRALWMNDARQALANARTQLVKPNGGVELAVIRNWLARTPAQRRYWLNERIVTGFDPAVQFANDHYRSDENLHTPIDTDTHGAIAKLTEQDMAEAFDRIETMLNRLDAAWATKNEDEFLDSMAQLYNEPTQIPRVFFVLSGLYNQIIEQHIAEEFQSLRLRLLEQSK